QDWSSNFADTWVFNGSTWTQLTTPSSPGARTQHCMTYDSQRSRTVLYGGVGHWDAWELQGSTWSLAAANAPSVPDCSLCYDPVHGRAILFGGAAETWEYDGLAWTSTGGPLPATGAFPVAAYDSVRNVSVTCLFELVGLRPNYGGMATYEFDGVRWRRMSPVSSTSLIIGSMAYDAARQRMVLFGDLANGLPTANTWEYDGAAWILVNTGGPPARHWHGLAYDAARRVTVLFGGQDANGLYLTDTWEYAGGTWQQVVTNTVPQDQGSLVYDQANARTVLVTSSWNGLTITYRVWAYDGLDWALISSLASPNAPPNFAGPIAYDMDRGRIVMHDTCTFVNGRVPMGDTWEFDGSLWRQVQLPNLAGGDP